MSFVTDLASLLDVLLVVLIPWSAINLADYFLVRRGKYDVASFFSADGAYGRFAWRGLLAYGTGVAAEWPFVSQPDYAGPLVSALGGAAASAVGPLHTLGRFCQDLSVGWSAPMTSLAAAPA